jgi:hypothetical protein
MINNKALKIILLSAGFILVLVCLSFARTDHRGYKNSKLDECRDCHSGSGVMSNHGAFFVEEHRLLAQKAGNNCYDCHQQSFCLDCHKGGGIEPDLTRSLSRRGEFMPRSHRSDFISIHSIKAADNPQNCYRCHESRFCTDCHSKTRSKGSMNIKSHRKAGNTQNYEWNTDHASEARRNLQSCESCHPDADVCVQCHSSGKVNPHPRNWRDISKRYKDTNNARTCKKCHITGSMF